jgi:methionyl-tRNA formyltransferase
MRIVLVTQNEPFYLPLALQVLCKARSRDIVAMIVLPAFNEHLLDTASRLYNFYGPMNFIRLGWRFVIAKTADWMNCLRPLTRPYSAADVARRYNVPVYRPEDINSPDFVEMLHAEVNPDLLISVAASQVLQPCVLEVPKLGCINLHSAPLPRYQGMMPNFWVLVHGEQTATVTVHYMVEELDAGDIILQRSVPIYASDSLHELMLRSKQVGARALLDAVEQIELGTVKSRPMDISQATYFSFPRRADARRLRARGHSLL